MDNRYEIAEQNGMSREFADWFFDNKKDGCGNVWFVMMAAMWEGWKGKAEQLQNAQQNIPKNIPEGYALVPIEPTESMIVDGFESEPDKFFSKPEEWKAYESMSGCQQAAHRAKLCWSAMLAAAPKVDKFMSTEFPDSVDLSTICAEAYQVVGVMADALGVFDDIAVQKILDNLSQQKLVHSDVLPFVLPTSDFSDGCLWTYDDHDYKWGSACGESWTFIDDGPEENGVKFCQGCSKPVVL